MRALYIIGQVESILVQKLLYYQTTAKLPRNSTALNNYFGIKTFPDDI